MDQYLQKLIDNFYKAKKNQKLEILSEIVRYKNDSVLSFLISALADENWVVRKVAADHIYEFGDKAIPQLSTALNSQNEDTQYWALQVLTRFGNKAVPAILRAMKSQNPDVRYFAAIALGELKDPQGVMALVRALGDEKWIVRKAASESLAKYGEVVIPVVEQVVFKSSDEDSRFWAIKTLGKLGPAAQKTLLEALRSGNRQLRYVIAAALGETGDKRVIKVLIESLADPDWTIRKSACNALAEIGEIAFDELLEALKSPNEDIRNGSLNALVQNGDKGFSCLFKFIEQADDNTRYSIQKSLVKQGSKVVNYLISLCKSDKLELVSFAASTLGEIGHPKAVPILIEGLSNQNWHIRRTCAYALTDIGERGVEKIAEALKSQNDDVRYWVTRILESIGEAGIPYLVKALVDKNKNIRYFAAKALASSSNPAVLRDLIRALSDSSWNVRKAAFTSICKLESHDVELLLRNLANDNEDIKYWIKQVFENIGHKYLEQIHEYLRFGDPELRLCACQALGIIKSPNSIEMLNMALKDDNEWVRVYAAISLGEMGDNKVFTTLIRALSDRNLEVHQSILKIFSKSKDAVLAKIKESVESNDRILRRSCAYALGELKYDEGLDILILLAEDSDDKVRQAAIIALANFKSVKAQNIIAKALSDNFINVRLSAINALLQQNNTTSIKLVLDYLSKCKDEKESKNIKKYIASCAQKTPQLFINLLGDESPLIRTLAAEALYNAGTVALEALNESLTNNNELIKSWSQKIIKRITNPQESSFNA